MKQLTLFLIASLFCGPIATIFAQEENYDAVYLSLTKEYTLNSDGTIDYRCAKVLKLQNYRSFNRLYGETFVVYNPDYQKLQVNQAYTIMADGKEIITPKNAFNVVLPHFAAHAAAYNQLREMVITHTGLEVGSTIYLDYQIHTEKGFFPAFMGSTLFAEEQPVKTMTVSIRTPQDQPVYFHLFNATTKPAETVENGFRVYTWVFSDIPAMESEKLQATPAGIYPALIFSSLSNYLPLAGFFSDQKAFLYETNTVMDGFVASLAEESQKKTDLVFAIQESVVKEINLFDIPEEFIGYRLRTPIEVWNSNGGTVAEKAVLMSALLKQAGISADPTLIIPNNMFDTKIGNLSSLEEWVVKTEIPDFGTTYLSVKQANAFDMMTLDPGGVFMAMNPDNTFQTAHPGENKTNISLTGLFVIDTALIFSGELNGTLTGAAIPSLSLVRSEEKLKHYFRGGLSSAKISDLSFSELTKGETSFTCKTNKGDALKKDGDMYYFAIPYFSTGVDSWNAGHLPLERQTLVDLPGTISESYVFTVAIPENMKLISGEQEVRIKNQAGFFLFLVKQKENMIQVEKEINIERNNIGTEDYAAFKELMDNWSLWQTNNLIFKK